MNVAFDANIWISFTIGKHLGILSHIVLDEAYSDVLNIHGCPEILTEYITVIKRPKLRKYIKPERVQETLDLIARVTKITI
ncbi:putative toxin-antitoxin system toxin component, PIN family [uncultured Fibrella sp.]|uniref:putative toxin-antitoxin system toxin component, PIN family n=1 Tax=uncultured Fibrella sp. TaxID=1284596 RepID=UPI0035CA53CD